jgi:hypothetical protein
MYTEYIFTNILNLNELLSIMYTEYIFTNILNINELLSIMYTEYIFTNILNIIVFERFIWYLSPLIY